MKKTFSALSLLFISINAFASMDDCTEAAQSNNWSDVLKYCEKYKDTNRNALGFMIGAYGYYGNGLKAQETAQEYINKYSKNDPNKEILAGYTAGLGNYYYFGEDGAKKDTKKGLQYITKGAELGNTTAQEQLGNFYLVEGEYPSQNMAISYKWFKIASINGNQEAEQSYILTHLDDMKAQAGYCLAMGEQLVAQSYIDGNDGLLVDTSEAKKYLNDAVALYKDKKPTKEILEHCPAQKGLDLANAEKLLASL
ncbi:sel1 repeat family protein [Francisella philomiragia]|uniref:Sel1 repeat family protein n=1 Tax=Francisella philomiragia TaxID=28110 RepID=A0A0B6CYR7_9GAMM|nr:sel1 repeat family protein [Francisella philomiragia]AJI53960.1 sel1 repeat family protein [Francisella philomiragia]